MILQIILQATAIPRGSHQNRSIFRTSCSSPIEVSITQKDIEDYTTRVTSSQDASHEDITKAINTGREALDMIAEAKSKAMRELDKIMTESEERITGNESQINP